MPLAGPRNGAETLSRCHASHGETCHVSSARASAGVPAPQACATRTTFDDDGRLIGDSLGSSSMTSDNHFISVSRRGDLIARRKGHAPVTIANAEHGLAVHPHEDAIARGVPASFRVIFAPGGSLREVHVTAIVVADRRMEIDAFQAAYTVSDAELGHWMRAAVEHALDAAAM